MYLTASRPYIMFVVCACARHQVKPKECHLHAVKRIFGYLKGHPKLGLWYPKASPFDLVAFSDIDYGGASQDRKSTTGGSCACHMRLCQRKSPSLYFGSFLVCMRCAVTFKGLTIDARIHTAKTFDLVWIWLGGDYVNVFLNGFSGDSVLIMCKYYLYGSLSEQRTHKFMHIYLATASVYVWIGRWDCFDHSLLSYFHITVTNKQLLSLSVPILSFFNSNTLLKPVIKMARLQFYDYHTMVTILEKSEFNSDFHPMVDFIAASPLRIETTDEGTHILATVDGI
nr:putative ribonuclease H-like domain-containing protein [Tanacetum cinerariifolium]